MWDKIILYQETGDYYSAINELKKLQEYNPKDMNITQEMASIYTNYLHNYDKGAAVLQSAIDFTSLVKQKIISCMNTY